MSLLWYGYRDSNPGYPVESRASFRWTIAALVDPLGFEPRPNTVQACRSPIKLQARKISGVLPLHYRRGRAHISPLSRLIRPQPHESGVEPDLPVNPGGGDGHRTRLFFLADNEATTPSSSHPHGPAPGIRTQTYRGLKPTPLPIGPERECGGRFL